MMRSKAPLWRRLVRVGLWAALVVLPLLLYLLVACGDVLALGPLRGDAMAMLLSFGWPVLLGGLGTALLVLVARLMRRYTPPPLHRWQKASGMMQPVIVGVGAYVLGCLVHWLLPPALLYGFVFMPPLPRWRPAYWWPASEFFNSGLPAGWTIFPPLSSIQFRSYALVPPVEAACIKLGALLATLLAYRFPRQRSLAAAPGSASFI